MKKPSHCDRAPDPGAMTLRCVILLCLAGALFQTTLRAASTEWTNLPPVIEPPDFIANKPPLPDLLLKDKRVGRYVTGFPIIGVDPETGFNYGAALQWFDNGPDDSPFFRYTPYRQRFAVAAASSTGGSARIFAGYDQPHFRDGPWRFRTAVLLSRNEFENYFGIGESTLDTLSYPGSPKTYRKMDDYKDALERKINGETWGLYNDYRKEEARGVFTVERDLVGGLLRPQFGLVISRVGVDDYTGAHLGSAVMQNTRLYSDYLAGDIRGFEGGWDNGLKLGLAFDTRNFEPDPSGGVLLQLVGRISPRWMGSDFDNQRVTIDVRGYHNLLGDTKRLILAGRLAYAMQFGDIPFYSAPNIPLTEADIQGLGGHATLRGYSTDRFVGEAMALASGELRWTFGEKMLWKQHLRFMLVPFIETGRVFDSINNTTLREWKVDGGFGFRLAWNLSTVVSFDYGVSGEGNSFYMELGHQF